MASSEISSPDHVLGLLKLHFLDFRVVFELLGEDKVFFEGEQRVGT